MVTTRQYIRRPRRAALSFAQQQELWLGVGHDGSAFEDEAHARKAWARHKGRIMELWGRNGKRPVGWWHFEMGRRHPGAHERSILYEFPEFAGVLSEQERSQLEQEWKREFDRSWEPGFSVVRGDQVYTGQIARELHWIWADLPMVLHDKWMAERRRRGRTIRKQESSPVQQDAAAESQ